jgi:hypothetical protein
MKPNTKKYCSDSGFSSQKASTRNSQQEAKACDAERWDHGGFDQLQLEQQDKYSKSRNNCPDKTVVADCLETSNKESDSLNENAKWTHDKYQDSLHDFPSIIDTELNFKEASQKRNKKEKRPDRQLYNARMRNEELKKRKENTIHLPDRWNCSAIEKKEDSSPYPQMAKDVLIALEGKEIYGLEDDKLSISNVSTAMSDKLKSWDEESYVKSEAKREKDNIDIAQSPRDKESAYVLFDLLLETENGTTNIRFYQGEEDYETFLDKLCDIHNFQPRMALYFKISILQQVKEALVDPEQIDFILDKLLDINYKLLMDEEKIDEAEECITPDIEREIRSNEAILGNFEDSD